MLRVVDAGGIAIIAIFVLELVIVVAVRGRLPRGAAGGAVLALAAAAPIAVLALLGRFGGSLRVVMRLLLVAAILIAAKVTSDRWRRPGKSPFDVASISESALLELRPEQRLAWAARVAVHAISAGGRADSVLRIPAAWAFPAGAEIRLREAADSLVVSALESSESLACHFTIYRGAAVRSGRAEPIHCGPDASLADAPRLYVAREDWPRNIPAGAGSRARGDDAQWRQYRHDAWRSGEVRSAVTGSATWRVPLDGEIRSTPSVVGSSTLIGTHGPGALYAFDARSGRGIWAQYLPNWIHQDAVSDGSTVVIGFGDNTSSLIGEAPSGVSAFSLATGTLLWSAFEANSVMASAVIHGSDAVYITSAGVLKVRDLVTGAGRDSMRLPGRATMAPPALVGDTLVTSLDSASVCAVRVKPLERLWCTRLPGVGMLGHSAPAVIDSTVYVSGGVFKTRGRFGLSGWHWFWLKYTLGWVGPKAPDFEYDGQRVWALDLATGRVRRESKLYASVRGPRGHVSGTMVRAGAAGVVILPLADQLVAFDLDSGRELWTQNVGSSRGPAAYSGGRLILTLNSGELRVVQARTGAIDCSIPTRATFDRAGPAIADSTVFLGLQKGILVALPLSLLTRCQAEPVQAIVQ